MMQVNLMISLKFTIIISLLLLPLSYGLKQPRSPSPSCKNEGNIKPLVTIGGMFMAQPFLENERNCLPAAEIAIDDINKAGILLPDHELRLKSGSTDCVEPLTFYHMHGMLDPDTNDACKDPPALALMGPLCGAECDVTGPLAKMYDTVQLSYGCGSATKEKRIDNLIDSYSNLFRMEVDFMSFNKVRMAFLRHLQWKRVGLLYHSGRSSISFLDDQERLLASLADNNITVVRVENFINSSAENIARLKSADVRIIFFAFNQNYIAAATNAGCEAYKAGLYGARYVWINVVYISPKWWVSMANKTQCTVEQLNSVFDSMFYVGQDAVIEEDRQITWTRQSLAGLKHRLKAERSISSGYEYVSACYDNVVILSYVLNQTEEYLKSIKSTIRLANFYEDKKLVADVTIGFLKKLNFTGFRGRIQFESDGTNEAIVEFTAVFQDRNGFRFPVYRLSYNATSGQFTNNSIWWGHDFMDKPPRDGPVQLTVSVEIDSNLITLAEILAVVGTTTSFFFIMLTLIRMRDNQSSFKATSPKINLLVLSGSIALYLSLAMVTNKSERLVQYCSVRIALILFGCSVVYGSLFAKAFRVYIIFTRIRQKVTLHDWKLFLFVASWTAFNMTLWAFWIIWDPYIAVTDIQLLGPYRNGKESDYVMEVLTKKCTSTYSDQFTYAFIALQGSMMTFGSFLAFSTRNVRYVELNDSKSIAVGIYTVTILVIVTVVANALTSDISLLFAVSVVVITIGTIVSQAVIFYKSLSRAPFDAFVGAVKKMRQWLKKKLSGRRIASDTSTRSAFSLNKIDLSVACSPQLSR